MKEIQIKHEDYFLSAVLHEAKIKTAKATIIISHGFRGSKEGGGRARQLAESAADNFNVIRYDFTPLGTLTRQKNELNSVLYFVKDNFAGNIILFGRSMGGCASLLAAAGNKDINGLILWSMPFDTQATFRLSLGDENIEKLKNGMALCLDDEWGKATLQSEFYTDLISHDIKAALTAVCDIPVLFVHGELDEIVPVQQAKQAFSLSNGKTSFSLIKGADHRFINGFEQSRQAVLSWLGNNF